MIWHKVRRKKRVDVLDLSFIRSATPRTQEFFPAKIELLGAERYVLGTLHSECRLCCVLGGFQLQFKTPVTVCADKLLGPQVATGSLFDIRLAFAGHEISMAAMHPELFPRPLVRGGEISVCPLVADE